MSEAKIKANEANDYKFHNIKIGFNNLITKVKVFRKSILNALKRENFQRNQILRGLNEALPEDFIIISDVDEIPNLQEINFKKNENKIILFNQKFFYYKLVNLSKFFLFVEICERK